MKRVSLFSLFLLSLVLVLGACSASESTKDSAAIEQHEKSSNDMAIGDSGEEVESEESAENHADAGEEPGQHASDIPAVRMIIHRAYLHLRVESFEQAQQNIENKTEKYNGYIVDSTIYHEENQTVSGNITVRIPEQHFQAFLTDTEKEAASIIERNITGEDVTEQYVDLESRLKSKRVLEERLLDFMEQAEKTEDLLKISSDLAAVQEEIEVIVGKMKYLENQTAFSTVEINMFENRIVVPEIDSKGLNTWEKTKKQFAASLNFLLAFGSNLIIFFIGNFPILVLVLAIAAGIYFFIRRKINRKE